jgi:hypothetical protein
MKKRSPIADALGLKLHGVTNRERMIQLVIVALEIGHRQRELGFAGGGSWHYRPETPESTGITWLDWVKTNAGFDAATYYNYKKVGCVVRDRLREVGREEAVALMDAKPTTLTPEQLQDLIRFIGETLREGDNLTTMRREYRRRHPLPARGEAGTAAPTARESSAMVRTGFPLSYPMPDGLSEKKLDAAWEFFEDAPGGIFWLSLAAASCRVSAGLPPSEIDIAVMSKAWYMGYELRNGRLVGAAAKIASMAEKRGSSRAEGVAIAQMILLDEGRGFPVSATPKPSEDNEA